MRQPQGQLHNMLLVIVLYVITDVEENVDGLILYCLVVVVQQLIEHPENLVGRLILLDLRALFLHELDQGDKLVEESNLYFTNLGRQDVQRHHEAINQKSFLDFVCEIHQTLRKIQFVIIVEILDIRLNGLLRGEHAIICASIVDLLVCIRCHFFKGLHSRLEAHLSLLDVSATELARLKLSIDCVGLLILHVKKFLVDQSRIEACPARLE